MTTSRADHNACFMGGAALWLSLAVALPGLQAQQPLQINSGGASNTFVSTTGQRWETDRYYNGGDALYTSDAIGNTTERYLYASARYGLYGDFEYNIPVPNGSYTLTLKFAELKYWTKGSRVFHVLLNGTQVLTNFDILNEVPARTALDKSFDVNAANGTLKIQFKGVVRYGIVSGIELKPSEAQPVTISVNPAQLSLGAGETRQFAASVGGAGNTAVTWSASAGTITTGGLYTAPAEIALPGTATVTATSVADSAKSASATVNLTTPVKASVTPASATVTAGATVQMSAAVTGTSDTRVSWSSTAGAISASGLFTAPAVDAPVVVTVTAQSMADTTVTAVGLVTVNPAAAPDANPVYVETNGLVSLEAESGVIVNRAQSWLPQSGFAGFSGSAYLSSLPNTGVNNSANFVGVSPEVQYRVRFSTPGTYYVWLRGYSTGPADDSVNVGLDGAAADSGNALSMFPNGAWEWSGMKMDNAARVSLAVANAGIHTVNIWMREDGFSFDKLVLTTDPAYTPAYLGPKESAVDSGGPVLSVSPGALSFSSTGGATPASQTVTISNAGTGALNWTVTSNQPWLAVSPATGSNAGAVAVAVNPAGMAPGNYTASIAVAAPGAGAAPQTIAVSLSVIAVVQPALSVSPLSLNLTATAGGANPPARSVTIGSAAGGSLNWTATGNQPWLTLGAGSGIAPATLTVGVNIAGLNAGAYSGTVAIVGTGAANSPQTVDVSLTVQPPAVTLPPTTGNQWHVAPNGQASGDGSQARPWDIGTALNGPSAVKPGDTIWLHGGSYGNNTQIASRLKGTAAAPIIVRGYPGERPVVKGGIGTYSPYTWYWGFEITAGDPERMAVVSPECFDTYDGSTGVKIINMILHDCSQGLGFWSAATDAEAHGNIIFYNGYQLPDRGHGHGIYTQNGPSGTKLLSDNIIFDQFGLGIQAYGSGTAYVQDITADGNIVFNNGSASTGGKLVDNILFAGGRFLDRITVTNNYTYHTPSVNDGYSRLGWQYNNQNGSVVATGNYWIGGNSTIENWYFDRMTFSNNVVYGKDLQEMYLMLNSSQSASAYMWNNNSYYGSGKFTFLNNKYDLAGWRAATGLDRDSTYKPGAPTGVWAFARANKYEPGRGNIVVYNWDLRGSVEVDVSQVVRVGAQYEVRDVENIFGAPVASGTYGGGTISIPMTNTAKTAPYGNVPTIPAHTGVDFGAFIIVSR